MDAYVRDAVQQDLHDACDENWFGGEQNEPSDDFVMAMDQISQSIQWRSKNYRILSEYSNSMSLSDSSIEQLLLLVRFIQLISHSVYFLLSGHRL